MFGATKPVSARLTVLFEPQVAASLMGIVAGMFSAEAVIKGRKLHVRPPAIRNRDREPGRRGYLQLQLSDFTG